jgi:hypothetical protein
MRMELLQLVEVCVQEASLPLCEEVATLKLLLARIGDSLESILHVLAKASIPYESTDQKSSVVEEAHIYGFFLSVWLSLPVAMAYCIGHL